jgi:hypothetical protein
MPVLIDGFQLKFNTRTRMAERRWGSSVDLVPVIWLKDWRQGPAPRREKDAKTPPRRDSFVAVHCADPADMPARAADPQPFAVALATTKTRGEGQESFGEFRGVFEVVATGIRLSPESFEARVVRRLNPEIVPSRLPDETRSTETAESR